MAIDLLRFYARHFAMATKVSATGFKSSNRALDCGRTPMIGTNAMRLLALLAVIATLTLSTLATRSAEWPSKPVHLIVPFAAGGAADIVGRLVADALGSALGQQVVVEDRAGGGGLVGAQAAVHSEPDGYTLLLSGMSALVLAPAVNKSPGFDPMRDLTHIAYIGGAPSVILAHPSLGVRSFKELIAYLKSHLDGLEYVSSGTGTVGNAITEYIAAREHLKLVHVPYKSGNAAIVDLLAGRVKLGSLNWSTAREQIFAGKLIPLAVSSANRLPQLADLPTLNEIGYPDVVTTTWHSLSAPAGLPQDIVGKVNGAMIKIVTSTNVRKHLEDDAAEIRPMSPAEVTQFIHSEIDKWTPVIRAASHSN
jgi:tripartite-type tricarboxylate transporter receptor subunit TctC